MASMMHMCSGTARPKSENCEIRKEQTAASAQAATGVTLSATEHPAVDELAIGEYIVTDGMCDTPIDYGDVAQ